MPKLQFMTGRRLRVPGSLAGNATAAVLHQLLIGLLAWTIFYGAIILPFVTPTPLGSGMVLGGQVAAFATALFQLRRGRVRLASLIYLSGLWVTATVVIVLNGGIRSTGLVWYVAIPISAAWLLGSRGASSKCHSAPRRQPRIGRAGKPPECACRSTSRPLR